MTLKVIVGVFALLFSTNAYAQSNWDHNGSVVTLQANGANRQFSYSVPRAGLPVSSGTVLFKGTKSGDSYSGTAYAFSSRCGNVSYPVSGPISNNDQTVTMYGWKPVRDGSCRIVGSEEDVLVFNFQNPAGNTAAANDDNWPILICLRPVFMEETKLRERINGDRATTLWVAQAINHLRGKYCREVKERLDSDDSVHLHETCVQYTGMFRGERVFWGRCHE